MTEQLDRARVEAMYASQLEARQDELDIEWWKNPEGVEVLGDEMKFLFVTDAAEHAMLAVLGDSFLEYQREHVGDGEQVTIAVMVMMGGMLPGVYLHDYVEHVRGDLPKVEFGTIGTKFYDKPGVPLKEPEVVQDVSIDIEGEMVGLVDDMGDSGRTTEFLLGVLREKGVRGVDVDVALFERYNKGLDSGVFVSPSRRNCLQRHRNVSLRGFFSNPLKIRQLLPRNLHIR